MGGTGLHVTHPVALTAKNTKDHHDETGGPGRCLVGCFSRCSQRSVPVLRKLQIRKALGNEQAAWRGARDAARRDGLAGQVKYHWNGDRMASSFPPAARRELLLRPPGLAVSAWLCVCPRPVEVQVGGGVGSPQEPHNLTHFGKEACRRGSVQRTVSNRGKFMPGLPPSPVPDEVAGCLPGPLRCSPLTVPTQDPRTDLTGSRFIQE